MIRPLLPRKRIMQHDAETSVAAPTLEENGEREETAQTLSA